MILDTNSLSAKLYRWYYNKIVMPSNLCPYFWKLVFMWIFIVPYILLTLPAQITTKFDKEDKSTQVFASIIIYLLLFSAFALVIAPTIFFVNYTNIAWVNIGIFGLFVWLALIVIGVYRGVVYLHKIKSIGKYKAYKEPKPSIIIEFVKAKYNKYCPKINWSEKK